MKRSPSLFPGHLVLTIICSLIAVAASAQFTPPSCNNWLYLPGTPYSSIQLGDLDVPGTQITVEAEFCRTAPYTGGPLYAGDLVSKHEDPNTVNYLLRPNDAEITTSDGYFQTPAVCDIALNTTYHVAMTYDGSTLKFYRNGVLVSQIAATGTLVQQDIPTEIGFYFYQAHPTNFIGYINEVRIWNVVRSQTQIQANMNIPLPVPSTQPGLLAYYSFGSLVNQQGNAAWNGTVVGSPSLGQTDPYCHTVAAGNPGTITGSNTCNNAPGYLTYHSQSGPGPFTITYSDGLQTYIQNNVMDGIPFAVSVQPLSATTYTLLTVWDATNCLPSIAPPGITAAINPGNCTLCTGSLGDPVIDVTFGDGNGNSPPLETVVPGASTTMTYVPVSGNPATPTPLDGQYTITNNVPYHGGNAWFSGGDHTLNDVNGYMLFANASPAPGEFFRQTVSNLCGATKYEFAAWIAVADNPAALTAVLPDLTFVVQTQDGTVLNTYDSGPIPQLTTWQWQHYGFLFTLPPGITAVVVRIVNNAPGGNAQPGNDFAMDDITFRPCGPQTTASFSSTAFITTQSGCPGGQAILYGALSNGYTSPQYLWQMSKDSGRTWIDMPVSNNLQYTVTAPLVNKPVDYYYRFLAADGNNIQSSSCRVTSNALVLTVNPGADADFAFAQDICNPLQVTFSGPSEAGVTYSWNINGTDLPSPGPGNATLQYLFSAYGTYPVTLKASGIGCSGVNSKLVTIQVQPADLITTPDTGICAGKTASIRTHGGLDFCWSPNSFLDNPSSANPIASPPVTTKYYFTSKITGANLILNGDFEAGNSNFSSAYTYMASGLPEGVYFVGTDPHVWNPGAPAGCGDHTTGKGNMMIINGATVAGVNVWTTGPISVMPNTNYAFSVWIQSVSPLAPAILQFSINGTPLGQPVNANSNTCNWDQFYTTWNSGNSTTATISLLNNNTALSGNDFALDDIAFAPITVQYDSITIDVETPFVTVTPADTTVCPGMPVPFHAKGSQNYSWSPATDLSNTGSADPVALPSGSGMIVSYTVTGTSALGCVASAMTNITVHPRLITISPDTLICRGDPAQLRASGGGSYLWTPAASLNNAFSPSPIARPDGTTQFVLTIIDPNKCTEQDSLTVRVKTIPRFQAPPDEKVCFGFSVPLKSANPSGYVYNWSPPTGLDNTSAPVPVASSQADIVYALHISDSLCAAYDSNFDVAVTVLPSPIISAQKGNDIDCAIHMSPLHATGGIFYVWTPTTGLNDPLSSDPVASIDSTTVYIVKGTGVNGCYAFDTLSVEVTSTGPNTFVVPNAFTPNGDGRNDCFGIRRWGDVQLKEMDVFNRWGMCVFSTRNPSDCWDGSFKGRPQETGAYVYVIKAHTFCGEIVRTGTVMLIR